MNKDNPLAKYRFRNIVLNLIEEDRLLTLTLIIGVVSAVIYQIF